MKEALLLARYQFLLARRAAGSLIFIRSGILLILFGVLCIFATFPFLLLGIPLYSFYALNAQSLSMMRYNYEIDASNISIYPVSGHRKFTLFLLLDLFHINGLIYLLSAFAITFTGIIRFGVVPTLLLLCAHIIYWLFFSAFFLCIRTLSRRNYSFYYIVRYSGSILVFLYIFIRPGSNRNMFSNRVSEIINSVQPFIFLLTSVLVLAFLYFIISLWFEYYLRKNPFPDPQLAQKFISNRWR